MADQQSKKIHYIVAENEMYNSIEHVYAENQEEAVMQWFDRMGLELEDMDSCYVYVVPAAQVTPWLVDYRDVPVPPPPPPPPDYEHFLVKGKKGDL